MAYQFSNDPAYAQWLEAFADLLLQGACSPEVPGDGVGCAVVECDGMLAVAPGEACPTRAPRCPGPAPG